MLRHVLAHNGGSEDGIVAHLATLLRPGGCLYLVDADGTAIRTVPEDVDLEDLQQRYLTFHTAQGNDVRAGLRLGERLVRGAGARGVPDLSDRNRASRDAPTALGGTGRAGDRWRGDWGGCGTLGTRFRSLGCRGNASNAVCPAVYRRWTPASLKARWEPGC